MERRRDRYFIIYTWKVVNGLVPNIESDINSITVTHNQRRGRLCNIPTYNFRSMAYVRTIREDSLVIHGPRLFNAIPAELRGYSGTIETFKRKLDCFLKTVPDRPALPHYYQAAASNSLLDQLAQQRVERM